MFTSVDTSVAERAYFLLRRGGRDGSNGARGRGDRGGVGVGADVCGGGEGGEGGWGGKGGGPLGRGLHEVGGGRAMGPAKHERRRCRLLFGFSRPFRPERLLRLESHRTNIIICSLKYAKCSLNYVPERMSHVP
jgi:hypothetical protein